MNAAAGAVVYIHVGAPKTGTTFLQSVMRKNRKELAANGVLYPGRKNAHFLASLDLRDAGFAGYRDPATEGSWQAVIRQVNRWGGHAAVLSHETFARVHRNEAARAVESLAPAEVHVVYATRNLVRQIPAVWQERVKNRDTLPYADFLRGICEPQPGNENIHHRFWRAHGPLQVLERWGSVVPPERIHVMTVPPSGSRPDALWRRFSEVIGIDPDSYDQDVGRTNVSLGVVEAEFLRRLNQVLPDSIDWPTYSRMIKKGLAETQLAGREGSIRITTPPSEYDWITQRTDNVIRVLKARGYDIIGDLADLRPGPPPDEVGPQPDDVTDAEVLEVSLAVAGDLLAAKNAPKSTGADVPLPATSPRSGRLRRLLRRR